MDALLGQWLNFKLFGVTYLVGKIKFKLLAVLVQNHYSLGRWSTPGAGYHERS